MPSVSFTKEDLLSGKQLKAGWRVFKIKDTTETPGKNDPESMTYPTTFVVEEGPDTGVPIKVYFSEKFLLPLSNCIRAVMNGTEVEPGKSYELSQMVGRKVQGYAEYDVKTGFNSIKDFKPAGK